MHFLGIECYFCMFFTLNMMNKLLRNIILAAAVVLCAGMTLSAQEIRPESKYENMLIKAVENYNARNLDEAQTILKEITAGDEKNDAAWYYLGLTSLGKGDIEAGEEYLRKATEADGSNFWYRYRLARLYSMTNRPELAITLYEKLLEDFPKKSDLYLDLVDLYTSQREYEKALETMGNIEKVFGLNESIVTFRYNILRALGREDEAYQTLRDFSKDFSSPHILTILGDHEMDKRASILWGVIRYPFETTPHGNSISYIALPHCSKSFLIRGSPPVITIITLWES